MRLAPRDTKLGRTIAKLLAQGKKGVVFLGHGGDVLAEVGPADYGQYVTIRKAQINSLDLRAVAYLNLVDEVGQIALVENHEGPTPYLSIVVVGLKDPKCYWHESVPNAMDIVERQLGKEVVEEEDEN